MSKINWNFLLDNLEDRQCILCVGPDILTEPNTPRFEQKLAGFLRKHEEDLNIRVYDNGWFHYLPGHNKSSVWKKLDEFYKQPNPEADAILTQLAALPFEAVISFAPDYRLWDIFKTNRPDAEFKAFQKNSPCVANLPSVEKPLIFNLLGELEKGNSLVLTYNDFYAYLKSVFDENSIPQQLAEKINNAQHFIFLGLPFDRWYTHLFMNILNEYVDVKKETVHSIHRVAANSFLEQNEMKGASEQHALTFVDDNIPDFVTQLYQKCEEKGWLVGKVVEPIVEFVEPVVKVESLFEVWRRHIKTGETDKIGNVLDEMADYTEGEEKEHNAVIVFTGQYNRFLSDKNRHKFETIRAETVAETAIINGILGTISSLEHQS